MKRFFVLVLALGMFGACGQTPADTQQPPTSDTEGQATIDGSAAANTGYPPTTNTVPAPSPSSTPAQTGPPSQTPVFNSELAVGEAHTCALTSSGGVKCWGFNRSGQLGDGTIQYRLTPADVVGLASDVVDLAAGGSHTCALTSSGGVKCWGNNSSSQLGDGRSGNRVNPVDVVGLSSDVIGLAAGEQHTCALSSSGAIKCWGNNEQGQLGAGTSSDPLTPVDVVGLSSDVIGLAAGEQHTCALTASGDVTCWGSNGFGSLGDGTIIDRLTPVDVVGLASDVVALAAGANHTCALTSSGDVKCWGLNLYGQLGDGTNFVQQSTPVDVVGLNSDVVALAAGANHTCAVIRSGGAKCWGFNHSGQLGGGTTFIKRLTPADVVGLNSDVVALAAGLFHTCAVTRSGGLACWGFNSYGQLGDGTTSTRLTPVDIKFTSSQ